MGSRHFICISLIQDRHDVEILSTVTGMLATPVTTVAVIATHIIIFATNESNRLFMLQLKRQYHKATDLLTRAVRGLGMGQTSASVVNSMQISNGCIFVPLPYHRIKEPYHRLVFIQCVWKPLLDDQLMSNDRYVSMSSAKFNKHVRQLFRV